jgi:hypothetical protein
MARRSFFAGWLLPHGSIELPAIHHRRPGRVHPRARPCSAAERLDLPAHDDLRSSDAGSGHLDRGRGESCWCGRGLVEGLFSQYHEPILPYSDQDRLRVAGAHRPGGVPGPRRPFLGSTNPARPWRAVHEGRNSRSARRKGIAFCAARWPDPLARCLAWVVDMVVITLVDHPRSASLPWPSWAGWLAGSPHRRHRFRSSAVFVTQIGYSNDSRNGSGAVRLLGKRDIPPARHGCARVEAPTEPGGDAQPAARRGFSPGVLSPGRCGLPAQPPTSASSAIWRPTPSWSPCHGSMQPDIEQLVTAGRFNSLREHVRISRRGCGRKTTPDEAALGRSRPSCAGTNSMPRARVELFAQIAAHFKAPGGVPARGRRERGRRAISPEPGRPPLQSQGYKGTRRNPSTAGLIRSFSATVRSGRRGAPLADSFFFPLAIHPGRVGILPCRESSLSRTSSKAP